MKLVRIPVLILLLAFIFQCQPVLAADKVRRVRSPQKKMLKGFSSGYRTVKKKNRFSQKAVSYSVPDVTLLDQDGKKVRLPELLDSSESIALNFTFVTCTTICPIMTVTMLSMQNDLGKDADSLKLISITIDPEHDTPKILKEYANKMGAVKNYTFLTGDFDTVVAVEKALDGYVADKMNHQPFTLFKTGGSPKWLRVDGLASGTDLAKIYRNLMKQNQ